MPGRRIVRRHERQGRVRRRHVCRRRRVVVLAKSLTQSRIDENLRIFDWELQEEDTRALDALARRDGRSYWDNSDVP